MSFSRLGIMILVLLAVSGLACSEQAPRNARGEVDEQWLRGQLTRMRADEANADKRSLMLNSHLAPPALLVHALYPVRHAAAKIVACGNAAVGPLVRIGSDPAEDAKLGPDARGVLKSFNDPRLLQLDLDRVSRRRMESWALCDVLRGWLPSTPSLVRQHPGGLDCALWLRQQLATGPWEQVVLGLMDEKMADGGSGDEDRKWGERLNWRDADVLRWLNRLDDGDADDLLAEKAPRALAFRNRERAKGYDPLTAEYLDLDFQDLMAHGLLSEGVNAVYDDPADREERRQLFETIHGRYYHFYGLEEPQGWRQRLQTWYWANRPRLVYDPAKLHFVVGPTTRP